MRLGSDLIVFDLEANQPSGKIFEIGAVRVNRDLDTVEPDGFQQYVNPGEPISDEIRKLCNLNSTHESIIRTSPSLPEVVDAFYKWATQTGKNIVLASWGNYDVAELHAQAPGNPFRRKSVDIKSILLWEAARLGIKTTNSLSGSMNAFGVDFIGTPHGAHADALNTARLLVQVAYQNKAFKRGLEALSLQLS